MYERFREILAANDALLALVADLEEAQAGRLALEPATVARRVRAGAMDAFVLAKNLNQLAGGRFSGLFDRVAQLSQDLEAAIAGWATVMEGPLTVPLREAHAAGPRLAGGKMAALAEAAACCGLRVPDGFVITTAAADCFLAAAGLWERCERLATVLELHGDAALEEACEEVRAAILAAPLPAAIETAVEEQFARAFPVPPAAVAVRSSAVAEDAAGASHAGVYESELGVRREEVLAAYRRVLASAFGPQAVAYRNRRGLGVRDGLMAVGVVAMIEATSAGIAYSRPADDPERDAVVVGAVRGSAAGIAAGRDGGEYLEVGPGADAASEVLSREELARVRAVARALEGHFGVPQDVEWVIDGEGEVVVLQCRPVATAVAAGAADEEGGEALAAGGRCACPGVGSGRVVHVPAASALAAFPPGGVLVAPHSDPRFVQVMDRCAAIVTEVGLPTGHMASLAREYGVPTIVGLAGAMAALPAGTPVTVNASRCRVVAGLQSREAGASAPPVRQRGSRGGGPAAVAQVVPLVTPLHLVDPLSPDFAPEHCRSLHDVARFVHEKAFEVMFHYGDLAALDRDNSFLLDARLPIAVRVFDLGGGVRESPGTQRTIRPEDVVSVPMAAFLAGLLEPRIRWDLPRPVSLRGFLSVVGEAVAGPPADALQVGRLSYAIVSDTYMNFSTKAGYHFSTVDSTCGGSESRNYVHFRFSGGAADAARRERRIAFLSAVLHALGFAVTSRGDLLTARLDKYAQATVTARLTDLGRLTLCARQLDMLMDTDTRPLEFAEAFLAGEWERF